ncbi:MAG: trypsin-like peptidase domain-containing protein [Candidatus Methanomethylophilaceae archaeon]|nr:trypsin-like peptidase domain-containing protein [Candidatus Methanomethylophilaceae archaeon]
MYCSDVSEFVYPVVRRCSDGLFHPLGTAFLLNQEGLLVTAAHVPQNNDEELYIARNKFDSIDHYQDTHDHSVGVIPAKIIKVDPFADICVLKTTLTVKSLLHIASSDDVSVGDEVIIYGYPHFKDSRMILTQQNSTVGAKVLLGTDQFKKKGLVINLQLTSGQSGSPVISAKDGKVVGMLVGMYSHSNNGRVLINDIDPSTLHQTTHVMSME